MSTVVAGVLSFAVLCATAGSVAAGAVHTSGTLQPAAQGGAVADTSRAPLLGAKEVNASAVRPFLLIHPSKTGGTSIEAGLGIVAASEAILNLSTPECEAVPLMDMRYGKHDTAATAQTFYSEEEWSTAFKFALVRNPWERFVSWWAMHATPPVVADVCGCNGSDAAILADQASNTTAMLGDDPSIGNASYLCAFSYYFEHCVAREETMLNGEWVIEWVNLLELSHTARQLTFMENGIATNVHARMLRPQAALVDFIGRTENLTAHLVEGLVAAGNSRSTAEACAASLPYVDESTLGHRDYPWYYNSYNRKRAEVIMETDIMAFGYQFGVEGPFDFFDFS